MKRRTFIGGALAASCAAPLAAGAQPLTVSEIIATIPGITGVVVRTMAAEEPFFASRGDEVFPSASVIKLAIMATVYRAYDAGTAKPTDLVRLRSSDLIGGSDVLAGAAPGSEWSIDSLVRAMIRLSDNSASNALMTAFGMGTINTTMKAAGMVGSRLARHFADVVPSWRRSENRMTPSDVATLLFSIERGAREGIPTIASPRSCRAMIEVMLGNDDRTKIVRGLPKGTPCAHKTGEIDYVRNDAGIVDPYGDTPYVLVVMTRELRDFSAGNAGIAAIAHRVDSLIRPH